MGHLGSAELVLIFMVLLPAIFVIIALIDIMKSSFEGYNKVIWVLVVLLFPVIGPILYFFVGRTQKIPV